MRSHNNNLYCMSKKHKRDHLVEVLGITLEKLVELSGSSVYALVCHSKKRLQVYGSVTTLVHLGRILEEIKLSGEYTELREDLSQIQLEILETNVSKEDMRLRISNWVHEFEGKGYSLYKDIAPLKYVLETILEYKGGTLCYCLYAKNSKKHRKLLGIFSRKKQLNEFVRSNYSNERVSALVVHESVLGTSE